MKYFFILPVFSLLFFAGCEAQDISMEVTPTASVETISKTPLLSSDDFIGLSKEEALELAKLKNTIFRVVEEDGEAYMITEDFRPGRINATVEKGIVVSYKVEGENLNAAFGPESWKEIIPESCSTFFDGCNNCSRAEGSEMSACTRKFCQVYEEPKCLDNE